VLPLWLWRPGNHAFGFRLHFCADSVKTIEWNEGVIGRGRKAFPHDLCIKRGWHT
jgi:hypothetical protein